MLLAIDIGNTSIHNGIFEKKALKRTFRIPTYSDDLNKRYYEILRPYRKDIDIVLAVSVVPAVLKKAEKIIKKVLGKDCAVIGRNLDSGVKNLYKEPKQVGSDRLVNARAAYELFKGECIIVDFGTAITIDIVNRSKEYLGGVIAPGPEISLWALSERTALLPKVGIKKPKGILGRETQESMLIGIIHGFSSLCDGMIARLKKKYCKHAKVIATGGFSKLIGPYCKTVDKIDPDLTLKGLMLIAVTLHSNNSSSLKNFRF